LYAYGDQIDIFDYNNVIAWQRLGDTEHIGSGLAVLISNGDDGYKTLSFGPERAGTAWRDMTGNKSETITLDAQGTGTFLVRGGSVSVWVRAEK
jgi:alpha-amylase